MNTDRKALGRVVGGIGNPRWRNNEPKRLAFGWQIRSKIRVYPCASAVSHCKGSDRVTNEKHSKPFKGSLCLLAMLAVLLTAQSLVNGGIIYSKGTSGEAVQAAIKSAKPGDTIIASNSVVTTNSITSTVVMNKPVSLRFINTHWLDDVVDAGSDSTRAMIRMETSPRSGLFWIDGLEINSGSRKKGYSDAGTIRQTGAGNNTRLSHINFYAGFNIGLGSYGPFGVVDHCNFDPSGMFTQPAKIGNGNHWGGLYGDWAWTTNAAAIYGTSNALFFEDCNFTNRSHSSGLGIDCQSGGIFVVRHCIFDRVIIGGHGTETTQRERGSRLKEVYSNVIVGHGDSEAGHFRSGTGVVWGNAFYDLNKAFTIRAYRLTSSTTPWGVADGANPWDANDPTIYDKGTASADNSAGILTDESKNWAPNQWRFYSIRNCKTGKASLVWANTLTTISFVRDTHDNLMRITTGDSYELRKVVTILDQPGRGAGTMISGSPPKPVAWPKQALEPIYQWSNTFGKVRSPDLNNAGFYPVVDGQELKNEPMPGYTPFVYPHPLASSANAP